MPSAFKQHFVRTEVGLFAELIPVWLNTAIVKNFMTEGALAFLQG